MSNDREAKIRTDMTNLSKRALSEKETALSNGGYIVVPTKVFRDYMPVLRNKYDGHTARDSLMIYLFLLSYVNGEVERDVYMWAFPSIEQICLATGIHKNRIKRLTDVLESEKFLITRKVNFRGKTKKMFLPLYPLV
jgi:hypothetical protein